jgi:competence protein ComGC
VLPLRLCEICRIATQSVTAEWSAKKLTEIIIIIIVLLIIIIIIIIITPPKRKEKKVLHARAGKNDASGVWNQTGKTNYPQRTARNSGPETKNLKEEGQSRRKSELEGKNQQSAGEEEGGASNNRQ